MREERCLCPLCGGDPHHDRVGTNDERRRKKAELEDMEWRVKRHRQYLERSERAKAMWARRRGRAAL
jgi:hypothetical protein